MTRNIPSSSRTLTNVVVLLLTQSRFWIYGLVLERKKRFIMAGIVYVVVGIVAVMFAALSVVNLNSER
jgi:hypothetical protein